MTAPVPQQTPCDPLYEELQRSGDQDCVNITGLTEKHLRETIRNILTAGLLLFPNHFAIFFSTSFFVKSNRFHHAVD